MSLVRDAAIDLGDADAEISSPARTVRTKPGRATLLVLAGVLVLSATAHLVGLHRDLPSPEQDEPFFVLPAVQMAATGSLDPHWFGHPGSTVIVPLALAYRAREVLLHSAPVTGAAPAVAERFRHDATSFYLIGRLWTILLSLASVVLVFALARRVFDDRVALIAAFCLAVTPLVVNYGRIVRTDSAGACFGLLALWAIVAALDRPSTRRFAFVGATLGLAVASRYFLVALVPIAAVAWWIARRRDRDRVPVRDLVVIAACAAAAFALITPYFFLDWDAVHRSLTAETIGTIGNGHHGWLENLEYYLTGAIPDAISWPAYLAALIGIVRACTSRDPRRLVLVGFLGVFLAGISASPLEWQRWIIPIVPVLLVFTADTVMQVAAAAARLAQSHGPSRAPAWLTLVAVGAVGLLAVTAVPAVSLVNLDRTETSPSTRQLMRAWIVDHVPAGARIAEEVKGPELRSAGYEALQRFDLPADGTVADYVAHGYRYFVVNAYIGLEYRLRARRFPAHAAFYVFLRRHGQLLDDARPVGDQTGPHLKLYRVDPAQLGHSHGRADVGTTRRSTRDRLLDPPSMYPVGGELLR